MASEIGSHTSDMSDVRNERSVSVLKMLKDFSGVEEKINNNNNKKRKRNEARGKDTKKQMVK